MTGNNIQGRNKWTIHVAYATTYKGHNDYGGNNKEVVAIATQYVSLTIGAKVPKILSVVLNKGQRV